MADPARLLRGPVRDTGNAAIIVTLDLAVVQLQEDQLMVLKSDRGIEAGLTEQVFEDPKHVYSQLVLSFVMQV